MAETPKRHWCPTCRKLALLCVCAVELSNVSLPVEVGNWRFVYVGEGPLVIEQGDDPQPYLKPYLVFNADSTGTATATLTASSTAA